MLSDWRLRPVSSRILTCVGTTVHVCCNVGIDDFNLTSNVDQLHELVISDCELSATNDGLAYIRTNVGDITFANCS